VSLIELAREVEPHTVREVTAVGELEAEDPVAGVRDGGEHGGVGGCTGVGLHVGVRRAEEALRAVDGQRLRDIHEFAATVVAAAGVALRVLVGEHGALRLEHRARNEVLARDHLERAALSAEFVGEDRGNLRVDLRQWRIKRVHWRSFFDMAE
jgi:hypothetical protein